MIADKEVRFSQHALEKFAILEAHGFVTTPEQVAECVTNPDASDTSVEPPIAQKVVSDNTVLRVVYTEDELGLFVITFYPGKRKRYENPIQP